MNTYSFAIDHKITAYERVDYEVQANTKEEAIELMKAEMNKDLIPSPETSNGSAKVQYLYAQVDYDYIDNYKDVKGKPVRVLVDENGDNIMSINVKEK